MHARFRALAAVALASTLLACGAPSRSQRVQEAAYELNMGLRFHSADAGLDRVAKTERERFIKRHQLWHNKIRIVDLDAAGIQIRDDGDANLYLSISWQRMEEQDIHQTVIVQRWHDTRGKWLLAGEERAQGDSGLFGEIVVPPADAEATPPPARDVQFRTITIREAQ
jgi:hypothetical protein